MKTINELQAKSNTQKQQDLQKAIQSAKKEEMSASPSKFLIPPPMGLPFKPKAEPASSAYDEDPDKKKFMRFLKMVERKNEASTKAQGLAAAQLGNINRSEVSSRAGEKSSQHDDLTKFKATHRTVEEEFEERDLLWTEGPYELHRKKKVNQKLVRGYCQMLDLDYNSNRMVVCGY